MHRFCDTCFLSIPEARLKAVPDTTTCVKCVYRAGDVPKIKRYDDSTDDGEVQVSSFYYKNSMFSQSINKLNNSSVDIGYWPHDLDELQKTLPHKSTIIYEGLSSIFEKD